MRRMMLALCATMMLAMPALARSRDEVLKDVDAALIRLGQAAAYISLCPKFVPGPAIRLAVPAGMLDGLYEPRRQNTYRKRMNDTLDERHGRTHEENCAEGQRLFGEDGILLRGWLVKRTNPGEKLEIWRLLGEPKPKFRSVEAIAFGAATYLKQMCLSVDFDTQVLGRYLMDNGVSSADFEPGGEHHSAFMFGVASASSETAWAGQYCAVALAEFGPAGASMPGLLRAD